TARTCRPGAAPRTAREPRSTALRPFASRGGALPSAGRRVNAKAVGRTPRRRSRQGGMSNRKKTRMCRQTAIVSLLLTGAMIATTTLDRSQAAARARDSKAQQDKLLNSLNATLDQLGI